MAGNNDITSGCGVKRKRRAKNPCPNPLFVQWVEEWRDEAKERGSQAHYSYTKALNSLKKYPLPLTSGQEARILDHIGERLAKKLDKRLADYNKGLDKSHQPNTTDASSSHCASTTSATVSNMRQPSTLPSSSHSVADLRTPKARRKSVVREYIPLFRSGPYAILIALHNAEKKDTWHGYLTKSELIEEAQPYCDKSFTIPDDGSYYTAWSSMSQIVKKGLVQRTHHPPRFSLTDAGVSMAIRLLQGNAATSIHSSLVQSPVTSTSTSTEVSQHSLHSPVATSKPPLSANTDLVLSSPSSTTTEQYQIESSPEVDDLGCLIDSHHYGSSMSANTFYFWYVNTDGEEVENKDSAAVMFDDVVSVGFLVKCRRQCLQRSGMCYSIDYSRDPDGPFVYAYIGNDDAPDMSNPPAQTGHSVHVKTNLIGSLTLAESFSNQATNQSARLKSVEDIITLSDSDEDSDMDIIHVPLAERIGTKIKEVQCASGQTQSLIMSNQLPEQSDSREDVDLTPSQKAGLAALRRLHPSTPVRATQPLLFKCEDLPLLKEDPSKDSDQQAVSYVNRVSSSVNLPSNEEGNKGKDTLPHTVSSTTSVSQPVSAVPNLNVHTHDTGAPLFVLNPGEFDVVLCVDNSESSASRNSRVQFRGILLSELGKNGVPFDVRKLNVGDFTWIAREKVQPQPGSLMLPRSREVVLEYVVERKRMDDLAGSIIDGRFSEQKFRLSQCGVQYPVYLVEDYADSTHFKLPERSLHQAIANTQVIDRFFIKKTSDIRESVAYLTVMTRALQRQYRDKTIMAHSHNDIVQINKYDIKQRLSSGTVHSMPFDSFNEASIKNKALCVYEMFGRQLVQLPGVSMDKAIGLLEKYPTISQLRDALKLCESETKRESLVCDIRPGQGKRRLGPQLSSLINSLYWKGK